MTLKEAGLLLAAGILLFGGYSWEQEREARIVAEQKDKDTQVQVQKLQQVQDDANKQLQDALAKQQAQFDTQMKTVQGQMTYLQNSIASLSKIGNLPQPIIVTQPSAPGQPTTVSVPPSDLAPLDEEIQKLQEDAQKLPVIQGDLISCQASVKDLQADNTQLKKTLKGGSFLHRLAGKVKDIGIGVGLGLAAAHFL
jgi:hypothetical protein